MQERSACSWDSRTIFKQYVTSDQLGNDDESPFSRFPKAVLQNLLLNLDAQVHPIATPPVLCWVCGAGFLSWEALYRHCRSAHGDWAECRKHLFWLAAKRGFLPLLPCQKRHMLANFSFFQCYSIPESGGIEWTEKKSIQSAVPRQEVGCAICARKDWLENRYRVYLWREPDGAITDAKITPEAELPNPSCEEEFGGGVAQDIDLDTGRTEFYFRTMSDDCFCLGNAQAVNRVLATSHYAALMPLIQRRSSTLPPSNTRGILR